MIPTQYNLSALVRIPKHGNLRKTLRPTLQPPRRIRLVVLLDPAPWAHRSSIHPILDRPHPIHTLQLRDRHTILHRPDALFWQPLLAGFTLAERLPALQLLLQVGGVIGSEAWLLGTDDDGGVEFGGSCYFGDRLAAESEFDLVGWTANVLKNEFEYCCW